MQSLTEKIFLSNLKNRIFSDFQLQQMLAGSPQSRYALVSRALKSGELLRLQRGHYCLANNLRDTLSHPFSVAQALVPLSYISFETALSWHGWIPEQVQVISSVLPGRKKKYYDIPQFGSYSWYPLALNKSSHLAGVRRHQIDGQTFFIAQPLRALLDLACLRKMKWSGLAEMVEGLRIETSELSRLNAADFCELEPVYKHTRSRNFLEKLKYAVLEGAADD